MNDSLSAFRKLRFAFCIAIALGTSSALAAEADQSIEALLRRVEQQINTSHTASPPGDSANDTWEQIAQAIPAIDPMRVRNALTTFAIHLRRRATDERKAGNTSVSQDMVDYVDRVELLKAHLDARSTVSEKPFEDTLSEPPMFEPLAGSLPPMTPPVPDGPTPMAKPSSINPEFPKGAIKPSEAGYHAWRGDLMLARKDVSAARQYYEFAASAGDARAAAQLARINDPAFAPKPDAKPAPQPTHRRIRAWHARSRTPAQPEDTEPDAIMANGSA